MDHISSEPPAASPSIFRWVLGFLLVGAAWGFTTPLMRRAAISKEQKPQTARPFLTDTNVPWVKRKTWSVLYAVLDLLKTPAYAIPLLLNVTGSIWFFLLIGQAGRSFTLLSQRAEVSDLTAYRTESHCTDHELFSVLIHSTWGMVGRKQSNYARS